MFNYNSKFQLRFKTTRQSDCFIDLLYIFHSSTSLYKMIHAPNFICVEIACYTSHFKYEYINLGLLYSILVPEILKKWAIISFRHVLLFVLLYSILLYAQHQTCAQEHTEVIPKFLLNSH